MTVSDLWVWKWGRKKTSGKPEAVVKACERMRLTPVQGEVEAVEELKAPRVPHGALSSFDYGVLEEALGQCSDRFCVTVARRARLKQTVFARLKGGRPRDPDEVGDAVAEAGLVLYDPVNNRLLGVSRPKTFAFEVEDQPVVYDPALKDVKAGLQRLAVRGATFAVLENHKGSYVQTAGSKGQFTVERRDFRGGGLRHFVAGKKGEDDFGDVVIRNSSGELTVRKNEVLDLVDVVAIFSTFHRGKGRGKKYAWREITDQFPEGRKQS